MPARPLFSKWRASATICSGSAPRTAWANTTVPTGFFSVPPSGPAMPVIATATSAWVRAIAPCAMLQATAIETEPKVSSTSLPTLSTSCLASLE